jgi:23S rRNA (adenine2030-N6)-methyltransferase
MLSYQHAYHAGCYADVIKHVFLSRILNYMTQKDTPLLYLETHGGRGLYDLEDHFARKTKEAHDGIFKYWPKRNNLPSPFLPFNQVIESLNTANLKYYPGSPQIAIDLLRSQDRLFLCELHPQEIDHLKKRQNKQKKIIIEETDGLAKIKALLPPKEKRAVVFIDPSYEVKSEYEHVAKTLALNVKKFPQGVYILWYPIVNQDYHATLLRQLKKIDAEKTLRVEFYINNPDKKGMYGTGLFIINPPYVLNDEAKTILTTFQDIFHDQKTQYIIE